MCTCVRRSEREWERGRSVGREGGEKGDEKRAEDRAWALLAAEAVSTETVPVSVQLIAPPLYVMTTACMDKVSLEGNEEERAWREWEGRGRGLVWWWWFERSRLLPWFVAAPAFRVLVWLCRGWGHPGMNWELALCLPPSYQFTLCLPPS